MKKVIRCSESIKCCPAEIGPGQVCVSSSSPAKYPVPAEAAVKAPSFLCDFTLYFEIEDDLESCPITSQSQGVYSWA